MVVVIHLLYDAQTLHRQHVQEPHAVDLLVGSQRIFGEYLDQVQAEVRPASLFEGLLRLLEAVLTGQPLCVRQLDFAGQPWVLLCQDERFVPHREVQVQVHERGDVVQLNVGFFGLGVVLVLSELFRTLLDLRRIFFLVQRPTDLQQFS